MLTGQVVIVGRPHRAEEQWLRLKQERIQVLKGSSLVIFERRPEDGETGDKALGRSSQTSKESHVCVEAGVSVGAE